MDERIRSLFVKRMGLILDKRKNDAAAAAMRVRLEANRRGMLHSSHTALKVRTAYEETYDDICRDAWSHLHRIAVTVGVKPDNTLDDQLREVFDEVMKPLAKRYLHDLRINKSTISRIEGDIAADAEAAFLRSREMIATEIELFSSNAAEITPHSGGSTYFQNYTFSGPVGAFQQGDHSTATVTQRIDAPGLESLKSGLETLLEEFRDHDKLAPLIKQASVEAAKPEPQLSHIRNLFMEIKAWISLAKDGTEIFKSVENVARECGMDALPPIPI